MSSLFFAIHVHAASQYDDVIHNTQHIQLRRGMSVQDVTASYSSIIADCSNWTSQISSYSITCFDFNTKLNTAFGNTTGWFVVERTAKVAISLGNQSLGVGDRFLVLGVNDAIDNNGQFLTADGTDGLYLKGSNYTCAVYVTLNAQMDPVVSNAPCTMGSTEAAQAALRDDYWLWSSRLLYFNSPITSSMTDYEGEPILSSAPSPRTYVALGDSFSSGEGNPPFESGTDVDSGSNKNICHRSSSAYPYLLTSNQYLDLTNFVACSGATTSNVINGGYAEGAWSEPPQVDALSQSTDVVTLTIGGNDVGFKDFATTCTVSLCDFTTQAYQDIHDKITNDLPSNLADVYDAIDQATSSDAHVYVLGYPNILPAQMPTGPNSACWPFNGGVNDPDPAQNNGAAAYAIQTQLNNTIEQAVEDFGSSKFQYVDPNDSNSPFLGHNWCTQNRYFNQITLNQLSYSYHPNILGHEAYATVMNRAMD